MATMTETQVNAIVTGFEDKWEKQRAEREEQWEKQRVEREQKYDAERLERTQKYEAERLEREQRYEQARIQQEEKHAADMHAIQIKMDEGELMLFMFVSTHITSSITDDRFLSKYIVMPVASYFLHYIPRRNIKIE